MIKRNYYKIVRVFPDPSSYFYIKNETMNEGQMDFDSSWLSTVNLEYSFDKVNWRRVNTNYIWVPADSYVYLRNTSGTFCTSEYYNVIHTRFDCSLGGDTRTLFNYTDVESVTSIPAYGFYQPFNTYGGNYTDISNLSFRGITSIGDYGLYGAFSQSYFTFTKGVDLRDVTTIGEGALQELYAYNSNLKEVYAPNVSTWDESKAQYWLNGVASTGVVYKPSTLTIPTNYIGSGLPDGWTTQDYPEE
jgi:hypothetical protein